jgi:hypothetical protein
METLTGYGTPGGWNRDKTWFNLVFYGMLGYKAYSNHLAVTGDQKWSLQAGLYAALRWKIWFGAFTVWSIAATISTLAMVFYPGQSQYWAFLAVVVATGAVGPGTTYVLAIDASLFRHRLAYRTFYRLAHRLRNISWPLLTMVALLPWGYVAAVYTIDSLHALSLQVRV